MITITHKKTPDERCVHITGKEDNKVISAYLFVTLNIFKWLLLDLVDEENQLIENKQEIVTEDEFLLSFRTDDKSVLMRFDGISKGFMVLKERLGDGVEYILEEVT